MGGKSGLGVIHIVGAIEPLLLICLLWLYDVDLLAQYLTVQRAMAGAGRNSSCKDPHGRVQLRVNAIGV